MPINKSIWGALKTLYPEQIEERRRELVADAHGGSSEGTSQKDEDAVAADSSSLASSSGGAGAGAGVGAGAGAGAGAASVGNGTETNISVSAAARANSDRIVCKGCGARVLVSLRGTHYRMCEAFQALPANERQSKRKKKTKRMEPQH